VGVPLDDAQVDPDAVGGIALLLYSRSLTKEIWVACHNGGAWCMLFSARDTVREMPTISGVPGTTPDASRALEFLS
jgi:hypothetical protein